MPFFGSKKDWKEYLPIEDENRMNEILNKVSKYRGAYKNAPDVKVSQIWCSILETRKEITKLEKRIGSIEEMIDAMFSKFKEKEAEKEKLYKTLESF